MQGLVRTVSSNVECVSLRYLLALVYFQLCPKLSQECSSLACGTSSMRAAEWGFCASSCLTHPEWTEGIGARSIPLDTSPVQIITVCFSFRPLDEPGGC